MSPLDISEKLQRHGIAPTPQRVEIAEALFDKPQHLSADQILDILRRKGSRVSKATVYNTLHLFGARGLARELVVDASRTFYDSTTHAHHHFYNVDSGLLSDIPAEQVQFQNLPDLPAGTEQESVEVLIRIRGRQR
ncbi:MAG: transcriptional repressor [Gammaproteobacteria bacterium]|nr:transcriptional repressor [Gammaproteobacteria bacterium]MDH4253359.1 transcriptional repressor [Gammaproteobacteria bacterium]MDH5310133.1 transcriptional repressor [Gammaproteobacteria bacterium]